MVNIISGKKGTGKTKILIEAIHKAGNESKGDVVAIQLGTGLNDDIHHGIRLINIGDYKITDVSSLYGFIAGLLASDYDCTDIFVDGLLKITGAPIAEIGGFLAKIENISAETSITFTLSEDDGLPDDIKKYVRSVAK
ncbi:hypothetical protein FACS189499_02920 [Clostridia bacterium]|nr:hypothetical protein FACS189499_02920 [Clostridia bacterium]